MNELSAFYTRNLVEAGIDKVGVGCLAGPIVAAGTTCRRFYKLSVFVFIYCLLFSLCFYI